jgi:hypothetical protein
MKHGFIFVLVIFITVFLKLFLLGKQLQNRIVLSNTLDLSWQTDMIERLLHGYVAGRDFIFTYGPLYQFIVTLPSFVFGQASYVSILYSDIILTVFCIIFLYLIIYLLTKNKKEQIILLILVLIGVINYDSNVLLRIVLPFFYGLLFLRLPQTKQSLSLKTIWIFALPGVFGLYTFDLFVLCLIISLGFVFGRIYLSLKKRGKKTSTQPTVILSFFQILLILFFEVVVSLILSGDLYYLVYSYDTLVNYQFVMNIPWSVGRSSILYLFPVGMVGLLFFVLKKTGVNTNLKISLLVLSIIALLQLKSALIRSDDGHIIMGVYPSIIVLFLLFFFVLREKVNLLFLLLFLFFYLLIPAKGNYFSSFSYANFQKAVTTAVGDMPFKDIYTFSGDYYFSERDLDYFGALINENKGDVMIYPYDSYILNVYGSTFNTLPLQFYQYSNSIVEEHAVERLNESPPEFIILGIDRKGAVALDNIPNFSRNPLIAKWMIRNYSVYKAAEKYLILRYMPKKSNETVREKKDSCSVYDLDPGGFMESNLLERIGKTSTYYLENYNTRLPYSVKNNNIFVIENYDSKEELQRLFGEINFTTNFVGEKNLKIIKKYPIPKIMEVYNKNFSVKCY